MIFFFCISSGRYPKPMTTEFKFAPKFIPISPPPNWRTPDHPPYAEMIQAAIRTLAEENGSTLESIDEYIKANYHDLPWGHHNLYQHYLRKQLLVGEIQETPSGRFVIAPAVLAAQPQHHRRPSMEKSAFVPDSMLLPLLVIDSDMEMQVEIQYEPPVPIMTQCETASDGIGGSVLRKKRGRPRTKKKDGILIGEEISQVTVESSSAGAALSTPKRRGRPPKNKITAPVEAMSLLRSGDLEKSNSGADETGVPRRRGRGRPRKLIEPTAAMALLHNGNLDSNIAQVEQPNPGSGETAVTKRRGRPPKKKFTESNIRDQDSNKAPVEQTNCGGDEAAVTKSRGRPRKNNITEPIEATALSHIGNLDSNIAPAEQSNSGGDEPERHARPRKKKITAPMEATVSPHIGDLENSAAAKGEESSLLILALMSPWEALTSGGMSRGSLSLPKRHGRPPKKNSRVEDAIVEGSETMQAIDEDTILDLLKF